MKRKFLTGWTLFFCLLALALIVGGLAGGSYVFTRFESLAATHEGHAQLLDGLHSAAFFSMVSGSMTVAGIGLLVLLGLHILRGTARIQREAEALRRKNEEMEKLARTTRELAHHQRLETIGTLTASMAHEFNNLLTPIMGYSMMALEKLPPEEEELYDDILEIYNASRKAKDIISRLNDLARKNSSSAFREISPDEQIRRTLAVAKPAKPGNVEIRLNLNCWEQRIQANEIQFSQLMLNLILNGFQAMEAGGVLTISTSFDEENIHIQVEDTGCGIPEKIRDRIFQPFFTTKEAGRGTGLGLAIAAQVAADHKGIISCKSREGEGAVFTVTLPRFSRYAEE